MCVHCKRNRRVGFNMQVAVYICNIRFLVVSKYMCVPLQLCAPYVSNKIIFTCKKKVGIHPHKSWCGSGLFYPNKS